MSVIVTTDRFCRKTHPHIAGDTGGLWRRCVERSVHLRKRVSSGVRYQGSMAAPPVPFGSSIWSGRSLFVPHPVPPANLIGVMGHPKIGFLSQICAGKQAVHADKRWFHKQLRQSLAALDACATLPGRLRGKRMRLSHWGLPVGRERKSLDRSRPSPPYSRRPSVIGRVKIDSSCPETVSPW